MHLARHEEYPGYQDQSWYVIFGIGLDGDD